MNVLLYIKDEVSALRRAMLCFNWKTPWIMLADAAAFLSILAVAYLFGMSNPVLLQEEIASGMASPIMMLIRGVELLLVAIIIVSIFQYVIWTSIYAKKAGAIDYVRAAAAGILWSALFLIAANLLPISPFDSISTQGAAGIVLSLFQRYLIIFIPVYSMSILFDDHVRNGGFWRPLWTFLRVGVIGAWRRLPFFLLGFLLFCMMAVLSAFAGLIAYQLSIFVVVLFLLFFVAWVRYYVKERGRGE